MGAILFARRVERYLGLLVKIHPAPTVTARAEVLVRGAVAAAASASANGDTRFDLCQVQVQAGDEVALKMDFFATEGKILTVHRTG